MSSQNNKLEILDIINSSESILIPLSKISWKKDIGLALALGYIMEQKGKKVSIILPEKVNATYLDFLPMNLVSDLSLLQKYSVISINMDQFPIEELKYDINGNNLEIFLSQGLIPLKPEFTKILTNQIIFNLIFGINNKHWNDLGKIYDDNQILFQKTPSIGFDTNSESLYTNFKYIGNNNTLSTVEIIYDFIKYNFSEYINKNVATALYLSLVLETDNFTSPNINYRLFEIASNLLELGVDKDNVIRILYKSKSLNKIKLLGRVLSHLSFYDIDDSKNFKIASIKLFNHDFLKTNTNKDDLEVVLDNLKDYLDVNIIGINLILENGTNIKEGIINLFKSTYNLSMTFNGEYIDNNFYYQYPSEKDIDNTLDEVNQKIKIILTEL